MEYEKDICAKCGNSTHISYDRINGNPFLCTRCNPKWIILVNNLVSEYGSPARSNLEVSIERWYELRNNLFLRFIGKGAKVKVSFT